MTISLKTITHKFLSNCSRKRKSHHVLERFDSQFCRYYEKKLWGFRKILIIVHWIMRTLFEFLLFSSYVQKKKRKNDIGKQNQVILFKHFVNVFDNCLIKIWHITVLICHQCRVDFVVYWLRAVRKQNDTFFDINSYGNCLWKNIPSFDVQILW